MCELRSLPTCGRFGAGPVKDWSRFEIRSLGPTNTSLIARLSSVTELHVPHLVDVEFLSVLRRLVGRDLLSPARAELARTKFTQLPLHRYPHHPLADRVWELRPSITACDGQFIALAEVLGLPLITCETRLAGANGHNAAIESFAR